MTKSEIISIIKLKRKEKKITQEDLAIRIDVAKSTINRIENEKFFPNFSLLEKICDELGLKIKIE